MQVVRQARAIRVMGIELRTSNVEAMRTIPAHWQRFFAEAVLEQIPGRLSDEVYAVYTHFENAGQDNQGLYSLILGAPVSSAQALAPGLCHAVLPASTRAVFPVPAGQPEAVPGVWQRIWQQDDLPKSFIADYECYRANGEIDIRIGLTEGASSP